MNKYIIILGLFIAFVLILGMCIGSDDYTVDEGYGDISKETSMPIEDSTPHKLQLNNTPEISTQIENEDSYLAILFVNTNKEIPSQILKRKGYILSYNNETKCPNWVSWRLIAEHTDGPYHRKGVPYCDEDGQTAYGIGLINNDNYRNGFFIDKQVNGPHQEFNDWKDKSYNVNHGHMCPAGDNKWDKVAINQSFLLTNICPQDEKLNGGGWRQLEEKCRSWANKYGEIYIVTGPIYNGITTRTLGEGKIMIPDAFFKVILCMHGNPKAIGFIYNNDSSNQSMKDKIYSVDEIEELIGFDFFSTLPDETESIIESVSNYNSWF